MISKPLLDKLNSALDPSEQIAEQFELNNIFHHFKNGKKNPSSSHIWVIGSDWDYKGNSYQWVKTGDWRTGATQIFKSYEIEKETKQALTFAKKHIKQAEQVALEQKEERHTDCKNKWDTIFSDLTVNSDLHEYLRNKHISNNYRARTRSNTLLVPIEHPEHGLVGVQQIFKSENDQKFLKIFSKGIRIKSSYTRLTNFDIAQTPLVYLCEGYATSCSVYEATNQPVITCFNCGNIIPVIVSLRSVNPSLKIIIAGDDDHGNPKNPGRYHANQAAKRFTNVITRFPRFESPDNLTDFNDLHISESLETVTEQLTIDPTDFITIKSLGLKGKNYYYANSQTGQIFALTASQHNSAELMSQAPRKYWGQKGGFKLDAEKNPTKTPDWDNVLEVLFDEQRQVGFFEDEKIRSIGAWIDNGQIVFNAGTHLFHNGKKEHIAEHSLDTKYFYEAKKSVAFDPENLPTRTEIENLIECFELVNYKTSDTHVYLLGTILLAQSPGLWSWRPHQWITGQAGAGKTTILSWLDQLIFTDGLGIVQNATAAGVRCEIGPSAISVIMDEAEPNTPEARKRMSQIMEMARQSSSNAESKSLRGTADGKSISFQFNSLFIMGSIQTSLNNAADVSRFTVIELEKGNKNDFKRMQELASCFPGLKLKLLALAIKKAPQIWEAQADIKKYLFDYSDSISARQADQLSWQIAAFWILKYDKPVDEMLISFIFAALNINKSDYIEANQADDENDCLREILQVIDLDRRTIYDLILDQSNTSAEKSLQSYGIRVLKRRGNKYEVFFSAKNTNLKHALRNSEYHDYVKILRRLPDVVQEHAKTRISGRPANGTTIELELDNNMHQKLQAASPSEPKMEQCEVPF